MIQFRWGSATSFNISDGTNTISSSGGSIIRANGESAKKEAIFISGSDKNVYIIGFKRDTTQYIEKLVTASDLAPTEITGTGTTGLGFTAKKSGNVVTVYLYCTADVSGGQSISFGTLPAGYRPPRNVKFLIHSNNGSLDSTQGMFADISSYNGGIASYSYVAITTGQCGVISYIVD